MARLIEIEGVGEIYAQKLAEAGIRGTRMFLNLGATRQGRKEIAEKTGIDESLILQWVNHADLMRVPGVGCEYSDLLEAAGVDTILELARRNSDHLYGALVTLNQQKALVRKLPTRDQVAVWIGYAKELPKVVTY